MNISHHLSDVTLLDYAAGALDISMEVVIASHLTLCPVCRAKSAFADSVGGVMLAAGESSAPRVSALELLAREIDSPDTDTADGIGADTAVSDVPLPLARLLPGKLESLEWRRIAPGIKQFNLTQKSRKKGAFKLLRLDPGVVLSEHTHNDLELTLVLKGSYVDEIGRFKSGDIADLDDNVVHQPVVDTDEPCIALIATLSPVRYSGMMGRLLQPFVGI